MEITEVGIASSNKAFSIHTIMDQTDDIVFKGHSYLATVPDFVCQLIHLLHLNVVQK